MTLAQNLLKQLKAWVTSSAVFCSFPLSCLLIGLEALIDKEFSCPCNTELNLALSVLIFIAPFFLAFILMFLVLRPFKYTCKRKCNENTRPDQKHCFNLFLQCLVPPVVWIFLVLQDGDYYACKFTDWNGKYVFDDELNTKWCKPPKLNEVVQQRDRTRTLIVRSEIWGYIVLIGFCIAIFGFVGIIDCCCSGNVLKQQTTQTDQIHTQSAQEQPTSAQIQCRSGPELSAVYVSCSGNIKQIKEEKKHLVKNEVTDNYTITMASTGV